jgi:hypothetical protein
MFKYLFILVSSLFIFSCTPKETIKYEQQYPQLDSVAIYYSVIYFPENKDTSYFFRTYNLPIKVYKNREWITFFYTIEGKPLWFYDGTYSYIRRINPKFFDYIKELQEQEELKKL